MSFAHRILAAPSDILYHRTSLGPALNILKTDRFELKPTAGTASEEQHGLDYYLSTARSPTSRYFDSPGTFSVVLVLDGRKLGQRYKAQPVDYWQAGPASKELEDRVWSTSPFISKARSYIKQLWMVKDSSERALQLYRAARLAKIDVKFVDDPSELRKGRPAFSQAPDRWDRPGRSPEGPTYDMQKYKWGDPQRRNILNGYLVLWKAPLHAKLPPQAEDALKRLRYGGQSMATEMHNAKGERYGQVAGERESLDELVKILRSKKMDIAEFEARLRSKWL